MGIAGEGITMKVRSRLIITPAPVAASAAIVVPVLAAGPASAAAAHDHPVQHTCTAVPGLSDRPGSGGNGDWACCACSASLHDRGDRGYTCWTTSGHLHQRWADRQPPTTAGRTPRQAPSPGNPAFRPGRPAGGWRNLPSSGPPPLHRARVGGRSARVGGRSARVDGQGAYFSTISPTRGSAASTCLAALPRTALYALRITGRSESAARASVTESRACETSSPRLAR
jgi:hypothetical protein